MKQYKHYKLGRTAKILDPTIGYQIYNDKGKKFGSISYPYSPKELLALGFEEVVDDGKERFSQKYVDEYNTKNQRACISSFLRDHDLLEE